MLHQAAMVMRDPLDVEFGLLMCARAVASAYEKAGWARAKRIALIESANPAWNDLTEERER
ncbi:MAG: hypothetical protein ACREQR_00265, partial [Candidatus Binataceae bacterium]